MLQNGASINAREPADWLPNRESQCETCLHVSCWKDDKVVVECLVKNGSDLTILDIVEKMAPLGWAMKYNYVEIAE